MGAYDVFEQLLKERGISSYQVSKATGIRPSSLTDWKKGRYELKLDKLQKIADYFGVTVDYLMCKESHTSEEPVQTFADENGYYTDRETAELAQRLFKDPKYRVLFDAADGAPAEDLQVAADMLRRFKEARGE